MGFFSNFLEGSSTAIFANSSIAEEMDDKWYGKQKEIKEEEDDSTPPAYQDIRYTRVPRKDLDQCFLNDPMVFGSINRKVQKIMRAGYSIESKKKKDKDDWMEFFDNMSKVGQEYDLYDIHERNLYDLQKYGSAYVERVFDENYKKIIDLKPLDARAIDYARDQNENIVFNPRTQRPLGYVIKLDMSQKDRIVGDELPEGISIKKESDEAFFYYFRVAQFTLFELGNGWETLGVIEPSYISKTRKDKIVEAITNELYIAGSNPIYAILGSDSVKPSKQQKRKTLEAIQNMRHSSALVFEHPTEIHTLDVKHSDQYNDIISYLNSDISSSIGYPAGLINSSNDTPRSALKQMKEDLDISEQAIVEKYVKQFNKYIMKPIMQKNNFGEAELVWGDLSHEEIDSKVKNLLDCVDKGIFTPKQVFDNLKNSLNLNVEEFEEQKEPEKEIAEEVKKPEEDEKVEKQPEKEPDNLKK